MSKVKLGIICLCLVLATPLNVQAAQEGQRKKFFERLIEKRAEENAKVEKGSNKELYTKGKGQSYTETVSNREFIIYTPRSLPPKGSIPLLVVLHGGFGNAAHIQNYIGLDAYADKGGFIVAYLNGTQVARKLPEKFQGWNAGDCCGQPQARNVDDVRFITKVVDFISNRYGADPHQVYGTGHSNGGMMTQRLMCETGLYRMGVSISGTLQMNVNECPAANGKHIVNIHGAQDENLPVAGGYTTTGFNKKTNYKSQNFARKIFESSGADYKLVLLKNADHNPATINDALWATENISLPRKIVEMLGLIQ